MAGDFFVVVRKVSGSVALAGAAAGLTPGGCYGLWFGLMVYRRLRRR